MKMVRNHLSEEDVWQWRLTARRTDSGHSVVKHQIWCPLEPCFDAPLNRVLLVATVKVTRYWGRRRYVWLVPHMFIDGHGKVRFSNGGSGEVWRGRERSTYLEVDSYWSAAMRSWRALRTVQGKIGSTSPRLANLIYLLGESVQNSEDWLNILETTWERKSRNLSYKLITEMIPNKGWFCRKLTATWTLNVRITIWCMCLKQPSTNIFSNEWVPSI